MEFFNVASGLAREGIHKFFTTREQRRNFVKISGKGAKLESILPITIFMDA